MVVFTALAISGFVYVHILFRKYNEILTNVSRQMIRLKDSKTPSLRLQRNTLSKTSSKFYVALGSKNEYHNMEEDLKFMAKMS